LGRQVVLAPLEGSAAICGCIDRGRSGGRALAGTAGGADCAADTGTWGTELRGTGVSKSLLIGSSGAGAIEAGGGQVLLTDGGLALLPNAELVRDVRGTCNVSSDCRASGAGGAGGSGGGGSVTNASEPISSGSASLLASAACKRVRGAKSAAVSSPGDVTIDNRLRRLRLRRARGDSSTVSAPRSGGRSVGPS
jgi:hypothetical protein